MLTKTTNKIIPLFIFIIFMAQISVSAASKGLPQKSFNKLMQTEPAVSTRLYGDFLYMTDKNSLCVIDVSEPTLGNSDQKTAYITIDDGPSRNNTLKNLDTLKKYGVKATFFVLPKENLDDIYIRIIEEGHIIGNHSCVHDYNYLYGSVDNFKKDVINAHNFLYERFQYTSSVFRFPGGTMGREKSKIRDRIEILHELGYRYFDWDVSTSDTDPNLKKYGNEEKIANLLANNVIKSTRGKKKLIILMHDSAGKTYTAKALPKIIEGLREQGYVFDVLTNY